jgi:glycosyltransferase involved in cell wall biosynthesis
MPVFNEGPTLREILRRVTVAPIPAGWSLRVLMVDDGSRAEAATAVVEAVRAEAAAGPTPIELVVHPRNRGKGAALVTGFDAVLARAADDDAVLVQDADLEYDPRDYPALLAALRPDGRTAVFGDRWATGGHRAGGYRRLHAAANRALTVLSNALTGLRVHDMECCYKLIPVPLLRAIRPRLTEERFGIEPQIAAALARAGARVTEVPVRYAPRTFAEGKKIRWTDGVHALWVIVREWCRR